VLDLWLKKLDFKNYFFFLNDISNFISTITPWIDMIFEIWELIPEQERLSNKKSIDWVCKILERSDINASRHFWKVEQPGTIQWTLKRENKQYSDQLGGNKKWLNDESVNWGQCGSKKDNSYHIGGKSVDD
jgi:hypothetical protein